MKKSIKNRWIEALRSGKYIKCRGKLKSTADKCTYCVMGVLCDLYAKEHNIKWKKDSKRAYSIFGNDDVIPNKILNWADMGNQHNMVVYKGSVQTLFQLNDKTNLGFKTLSNLIEEQL